MVEATCHCGAVRVEVPKPPQEVEVKECNCSICRRTGAVLAYYSPRDVRVSGATDTYVNVRLMPPELLTDLRILKFDGADTWTVVGERRGI